MGVLVGLSWLFENGKSFVFDAANGVKRKMAGHVNKKDIVIYRITKSGD